jgi:magnesium chelatase subunit D
MTVESDAALVAALFAVDPAGLGGVVIRSPVQPAREQWLAALRDLLPVGTPVRKLPFNIPDGRLLGGLDLVATLKANRPIAERGVLADANGGVAILTMAERLGPGTAARLCGVIDVGEVQLPREGVTISHPASFGLVALDEGIDADEGVPTALLDRVAFLVDLGGLDIRAIVTPDCEPADIVAARALLPDVRIDTEMLQALCATALGLGAGSPRVSVLAARTARAAAALAGRSAVTEEDAVTAGRLVLAPRATIAPAPPQAAAPEDSPQPPEEPPEAPHEPPQAPLQEPPADPPPDNADAPEDPEPDAPLEIDQQTLEDVLLAATAAAIPPGLLARLRSDAQARAAVASRSGGRVGEFRRAGARGRPAGISAGPPRGAARLNVIETLRAAAPWQRLRGRSAASTRIRISPDDFRVSRHQQRAQTLTIFTVDASGSSALNRLAEAKGAVELLLADCYVRRDQVAVIAFRGKTADVLLPPTRSLVRAKRSLAGLPGGGGTPLASALDAATALARLAQRRGETPTVVLLTDGRANIARDGAAGREPAHADALKAARALAAAHITALFIDTSPRPSELAKAVAVAMRAQYVPLPFANARSLAAMVKAATATPSLQSRA